MPKSTKKPKSQIAKTKNQSQIENKNKVRFMNESSPLKKPPYCLHLLWKTCLVLWFCLGILHSIHKNNVGSGLFWTAIFWLDLCAVRKGLPNVNGCTLLYSINSMNADVASWLLTIDSPKTVLLFSFIAFDCANWTAVWSHHIDSWA